MGAKAPSFVEGDDEMAEKSVLTVEVKATELPLVQQLIDALRDDFDNLPAGVKAAVNAILDKDRK